MRAITKRGMALIMALCTLFSLFGGTTPAIAEDGNGTISIAQMQTRRDTHIVDGQNISVPNEVHGGKTDVKVGEKTYSMPVDKNGDVVGSVYNTYLNKPQPKSLFQLLSASADPNGYLGEGLQTIISLGDIPHYLKWYSSPSGTGSVSPNIHATVWVGDPNLSNGNANGLDGYKYIGYCLNYGKFGANNKGQNITAPDGTVFKGYPVNTIAQPKLTMQQRIAMSIIKNGYPANNFGYSDTVAFEITQYSVWTYLTHSRSDGTYTGDVMDNMWTYGEDANTDMIQ